MKIYAIMSGDQYEGMWPAEEMYKDRSDAQKALQIKVLHKNNEAEKDEWDNVFVEEGPDRWTDGFDWISIKEYELV